MRLCSWLQRETKHILQWMALDWERNHFGAKFQIDLSLSRCRWLDPHKSQGCLDRNKITSNQAARCRASKQIQILFFQITAVLPEYAFILFVMRNGRPGVVDFWRRKGHQALRSRVVHVWNWPAFKWSPIPIPAFCCLPHALIRKDFPRVTTSTLNVIENKTNYWSIPSK